MRKFADVDHGLSSKVGVTVCMSIGVNLRDKKRASGEAVDQVARNENCEATFDNQCQPPDRE